MLYRIALLITTGLALAPVWLGAQTMELARRIAPDREGPTPPAARAIELKHLNVKVRIADQVATTEVDQVFHNANDWQAEGTYLFPLPEGTTISHFRMFMGGKAVQGEILDADKAREIYQSIVRQRQDPGLLEFVGHRLIRASVFPIPARGDVRIQITFDRVIAADRGWLEYNYPLSSAGKRIAEVGFDVTIVSQTAIKTVYCPTHDVDITRNNDREVRVRYEKTHLDPERSFNLLYATSDAAVGMRTLAHRRAGEDGYFMLAIAPKVELAADEIVAKRIVFVLDTSGSMAGPKMEQARKALEYCVHALAARDRFSIVRFSTEVEAIDEQRLLVADATGKQRALNFIKDLDAAGGTNIDEALELALGLLGRDRSEDGSKGEVVFITDGKPTIGERDSDAILKNVAGRNAQAASRVFVFGVGEDLNTHLLDKLAEQHRGTRTYVAEQESIEAKVSSFYDKVKSPVLTDLQLDFGDLQVKHVYPRQLGDLFAGGQLLVFGRYRAGEAASDHAITLTGNVSGKPQRFTYEASFPADETGNAFLPRLWAQRKVGHLLDELRLHGDNPELKQEVIELGKRFGIVTPYTSALVLEDAARPMLAMRRGGAGGGEQQDGQGAAPEPANAPADSGKLLEHERLKADRAMRAESGRNAVEQSESIRKMQDSDSLDEANDHYETLEGKATQRLIRRIEDRTFIRGQDGTYVESELLAKPEAVAAAVKIEYLSQAYFDLAASSPLIARYLKVGSRVIFSFESKVYSIAPAATEPEQAPEQKTPEQPRD